MDQVLLVEYENGFIEINDGIVQDQSIEENYVRKKRNSIFWNWAPAVYNQLPIKYERILKGDKLALGIPLIWVTDPKVYNTDASTCTNSTAI